MIECTRRLQFCAGHRVHGHESKCANMHGHNYVVYIDARANDLDAIGRVIDFSVLKEKFGTWIDENWDHAFIYWAGDEELVTLFLDKMPTMKSFMLETNPTAENMARHLVDVVAPKLLTGTDVIVTRVVLWETENCYATYKRLDQAAS